MKARQKGEYVAFQAKLMQRVCGSIALSALSVLVLYLLFWKRRMGDWIVWFLENVLRMDSIDAFYFFGAIRTAFSSRPFRWFSR